MEKLKILEVTDAFYPAVDGVVRVVDNYAVQLNKIADCTVLAPAPSKKSKYKDAHSYRVLRCYSSSAPEGYRMALPFGYQKLKKLILKEKFDIIHIHSPFTMGRIAMKIAKKQNIPIVMTLHTKYKQDFERSLGKKSPLVKFMMSFVLTSFNRADSVWTVSAEAANVLRSYGYEGKIDVVRNATDCIYPNDVEQKIKKINALHNLEGQNNVFLFVGRMAMYKGLNLLCDALEIVKDRQYDFKMIFVGGGFDLVKVKKYAIQKGIYDYCIFTDTITDKELIQAYYLRGEALIFPSTFDTSGVVKVEAAAHKKAAVLIKDSCSAEEVIDDYNGFLCEENDLSLADRICSLCDNPEKTKEVGEHAYESIYKTWEDVSKEVLKKYRVIIDEKKSGLLDTSKIRKKKLKTASK